MRRLPAFTVLNVFIIFVLGLLGMSCNGSSTSSGGGFQSAQGTGYVFMGDTPPAGSSILRFEITLSSATLCPTLGASGECTGNPQVSLISAPVQIEMSQLQLQSAFLSTKTVAAGSYAGVRLVFSNPQLKILLPDGTLQELEGTNLPLVPTAVSPTFPSSVTVSDKTNFGFLIDFDMQNSIQSSGGAVTGIAPVVSLVPQTFTTQQPVQEMEDTTGAISNVSKTCASGTGSFTIVNSTTGLPVTGVQFDSTTELDDGASCDTLTNGQVVDADIQLLSQDTSTARFFAKKIELSKDVNEDGLEGTILQVNTASGTPISEHFVLVVDHSTGIVGFAGGEVVTVSFDPLDVQFKVESNSFSSLPSFASAADLLAGQVVDLNVVSSAVGTNSCAALSDNCTATVDRVKLKMSTVTGSVGQVIVSPDFALVTLPSIFGTSFPLVTRPLSADCQNCLIDTLTVRTSTATVFEDIPGDFNGLLTGSPVTVRGLLFKDVFLGPGPISSGTPRLVAEKIRLVTPAP